MAVATGSVAGEPSCTLLLPTATSTGAQGAWNLWQAAPPSYAPSFWWLSGSLAGHRGQLHGLDPAGALYVRYLRSAGTVYEISPLLGVKLLKSMQVLPLTS